VIYEDGTRTASIEASLSPHIPGPLDTILITNDTVDASSNVSLIAYKLDPQLAPAIVSRTIGEVAPAQPLDPFALALGGLSSPGRLQLAYEIAKLKNAKFIFTGSSISSTNEYTVLLFPIGTNYQVPTGKKLIIFAVTIHCTVGAKGSGLGYGDNAVSNSSSAPTNFQAIITTHWENATVLQTFDELVYAEVPAEKFPHQVAESTSGTNIMAVFAIEADA